MGTNFYMFTAEKAVKPFFGSKLEVVDEPGFGYMVHIAKTSAGWKPLFEAHEHIRSVADLKLLYNKGNVQIYDEYNQEYSWDEFVERVVNFGDNHNWRTGGDDEFTSVDGYWFSENSFS